MCNAVVLAEVTMSLNYVALMSIGVFRSASAPIPHRHSPCHFIFNHIHIYDVPRQTQWFIMERKQIEEEKLSSPPQLSFRERVRFVIITISNHTL